MASARLNATLPASFGLTSHALPGGDAERAPYLRHIVELASRQAAVATAQAPDGRLAAVPCADLHVLGERELLVAWSLPLAADSQQVFERASHFAVNVLGSEAAAWLRGLGQAGHEKFAGIAFEFGRGGAPLLECAVATLECVNRRPHRRGAHAMFVGRALQVRSTGEPAPLSWRDH
jgi:flavin reductase (DIM6/NTAB) family NADH-FMN oxidoreductase RutF